MTDYPRVTVVTVTKNNYAGLVLTCESVDTQIHADIEHLIIDGCSTDQTPEFLKSRPQKWITMEPDNGIYDAMNKGFKKASGDVLIFLNSGDTFTNPRVISEVMEYWSNQKPDWGYGAIRFVSPARDIVGAGIQDPFSFSKFALGVNYVPHPASFVALNFARRIGAFDEEFGVAADQEWLFRAALESTPTTWPIFITDFELGGAHEGLHGLAKARIFAKIRKKHGVLIAKNALADTVATVAIGTYWSLRRVTADLVKKFL